MSAQPSQEYDHDYQSNGNVLPVKYGLKYCLYITKGNAGDWTTVDPTTKYNGIPLTDRENILIAADLASDRNDKIAEAHLRDLAATV